ncbi:Hypothetical predicted protein [Paramuricea clavata]|nr:Hypothetical predicted protein [Paramuricea clavata]
MAAEGVLHHKSKSRNRGVSWQKVVERLNALPSFDVNTKSVRDRFNLLAKKYKVKMGKQERATGGGGIEVTEAENLLEELIAMEEDANERADEESRARQIVEDEDKAKAIEMRKRAMESMGETRERLGKKNEEKRRRSGNQSMVFLEKAIETKQKMQEEEKRAREEERRDQQEIQTAFLRQLEVSQQQHAAQSNMTEQHLLQSIAMQQQQQQQQMQQFSAMQNNMMALMEQQRQQSEMILELFKKTNNN